MSAITATTLVIALFSMIMGLFTGLYITEKWFPNNFDDNKLTVISGAAATGIILFFILNTLAMWILKKMFIKESPDEYATQAQTISTGMKL